MNIVFVVNNKKKHLEKVIQRLVHFCDQKNFESVQFIRTLRKKHAIELAKEATENGCDYLIAVGGDGTLHEVINGMIQSNKHTSEYPVIGLLPYGSANDFARTAGISNSIEKLIELIQSNTHQKIDLGKIQIHQTQEIRYFINIAGVGLSAEVVQKLEQSSSGISPGLNYLLHIAKELFSYVKKKLSCTSTTWKWEGKLLQMAVANGRFFGNEICIAPDAKLTDGQFQVAIIGDLKILDYLRTFGKLKKGVKLNIPEVRYHHSKQVLLESEDSCEIEADGEYVGLLPATISVLPQAISFLMPPK